MTPLTADGVLSFASNFGVLGLGEMAEPLSEWFEEIQLLHQLVELWTAYQKQDKDQLVQKGLTLLIVSPRGQRVIDQQAGPMALEDKKSHAISWTRDERGRMSVSVDGREILATVDRGFGDPFQGLSISNGGGDFIIKRISVTSGS